MAEESSSQDKTEKPTPKRLADARKEGQIARSREVNTMVSLFFGSMGFVLLGDFMVTRLTELFKRDFSLGKQWLFDPARMLEAISMNTVEALALLAPFLLLMFVSVFIGPLFIGGWSFSAKALAPKFSKMNPITGIKRVFGPNGLVELVKALVKFVLLGVVAALVLYLYREQLVGLGVEPVGQGLLHGATIFFVEFFALTAALVLIAGFDAPYQIWNHRKKLKMTKQELREETKQTEGNPEVKGRIKALQREIAQRRMLDAVPEANVVIVNPTHFSVALKYEEGKERAPRVVARGVDQLALKIREIARAHEVPVFSAPPLARALYYSSEVDQPVPEGLYVAVARVLAWVFQLRTSVGYVAPPEDLEIPEEFLKLDRKNTRFER